MAAVLTGCLALVGVLVGPGPVSAQTPGVEVIVVNAAGDLPDANPDDGVCETTTVGECTLRAAIETANRRGGPDTVNFDLADSTIRLNAPLPPIDDYAGPLTIDGYSQPGSGVNTAPHGSNAVIGVNIEGSSQSEVMFVIYSSGNTIRGLAMYSASTLVELSGEQADGNKIIGNFIGTNAAGTFEAAGAENGSVWLHLGADRNQIGRPDLADRNVIGGGDNTAILVEHGQSSENRFQNNLVGLSPDGSRRLKMRKGIDLQWWTWGNLIGGTGPNEGNVFSPQWFGIEYSHNARNNVAVGNFVGTTIDGRGVAPYTKLEEGLVVKDDAVDNYFVDNLVVNAKYGYSSHQNYNGRNYVIDNVFGLLPDGTMAGNRMAAMEVKGHDDVLYGNVVTSEGQEAAIKFSDTTERGGNTTHPNEQTLYNGIHNGVFLHRQSIKEVWVYEAPTHNDVSPPIVTGYGVGQVSGSTCGWCPIEVYGEAHYDPASGQVGFGSGEARVWMGTVTADGDGFWSLGDSRISEGMEVMALTHSINGSASEFSNVVEITATGVSPVEDPTPGTSVPKPEIPSPPSLWTS